MVQTNKQNHCFLDYPFLSFNSARLISDFRLSDNIFLLLSGEIWSSVSEAIGNYQEGCVKNSNWGFRFVVNHSGEMLKV